MARTDVAPTKSNLLTLKNDLSFAKEGFDLLDEKRQILVLELMRHLERAKRLQAEADEAMAAAYAAMRTAVLAVGRRALATLAEAVPISTGLSVESHRLMGIHLPTVQYQAPKMTPRYGLAASSVHSDELHAIFAALMPVLAELAEIENSVVRLARELKKTQRRVNALEKLFIPDTQTSIKFISDTLDEREREALGIMRIVKNRAEALVRQASGRTDAPPPNPGTSSLEEAQG